MPSIPLTNNFIPAFNFQEVLIDKTTGFPLAKGIVTFYQDAQRTVLKDIFQLTGIPGNYTVTQLPNPITLSSVGTFEDNSGNDIVPYFYPYDITGQPEYYYVTVYSSADGIIPDVLQFTREHVPFIENQGSNSLSDLLKNFIPDGQFLIHNDGINANASPTYVQGTITAPVTNITQNGWTFERDVGSTSVDTVAFIRIPITNVPVGNPRYGCKVACITPGGSDTYKYLSVSFGDVNKFANDNTYTFAFSAKATSAQGIVAIKARKNYGTGGSPEEIIDLGTALITTSDQMFNFSFSLGSNIGKNLGTLDDDFCSFMISFLPNQAFSFQFTDFILSSGNITFNSFPVTTDSEFSYETLGGSIEIPAYDSSDLYLPLVLTKSGIIFDDRNIGNLIMKTTETLEIGQLWANGASYDSEGYSSDGIPYSRLANKWWYTFTGDSDVYKYGSGISFVTMEEPLLGIGRLNENNYGAVTLASDGAIPTGFTFTTIQVGDVSHNYIAQINYLPGSSITPGSYWIFYGTNGLKYYIWYRVNGIGADPLVSGAFAGIVVDILSTDTAQGVGSQTQFFVNKRYFAVPDYRGFFPRFWNNGRDQANVDPDYATRGSSNTGSILPGDHIGTIQYSQNLTHAHDYFVTYSPLNAYASGDPHDPAWAVENATTTSSGGSEARSTNMYVGAAIWY
jgi:hypothetical protein